ncbi:hypothetical protein CCACVL1_00927, partial [Corchorus capsularis]
MGGSCSCAVDTLTPESQHAFPWCYSQVGGGCPQGGAANGRDALDAASYRRKRDALSG